MRLTPGMLVLVTNNSGTSHLTDALSSYGILDWHPPWHVRGADGADCRRTLGVANNTRLADSDPMSTSRDRATTPSGSAGPKVVMHIGEPKTGTTFLQQVLWRNRGELAAQGVTLPGHHPQDHYRASQDLRGIKKLPSDPAGSWSGEWEILAREAQQAERVAVISHELFSAVDGEQADRAVRSLLPADVHVVVTVRDMATLLPAEWQETVKHRSTRTWPDWLADVIDRESTAPDRRQWWFWRVHDTMAILEIWSRLLPAENVHVIITPPAGSPSGELWRRFASVLGVDAGFADLSRARPNVSLGVAETEFLRLLNQTLPDEVPDWFYMWNVKEGLAHKALTAAPESAEPRARLVLPADREPWAKEQAALLADALTASGYDIIGEITELVPRPATHWSLQPANQPVEAVLDVAARAAAALLVNHYRKEFPAARPQREPDPQRGLVSRVESAVASSPRIKRTVRDLSSRSRAVRRMRIAAWSMTRPRRSATSRKHAKG